MTFEAITSTVVANIALYSNMLERGCYLLWPLSCTTIILKMRLCVVYLWLSWHCKAKKSIHLCIRALEAALMYCTIAMVKKTYGQTTLNSPTMKFGAIDRVLSVNYIFGISVVDFQKYSLMIFSIWNNRDYCQLSLFLWIPLWFSHL